MQLILTICAALLATVADGLPEGKIIGGSDARVGQLPYHSMIKYKGEIACGSMIISKCWILTAAHCVSYIKLPSTQSSIVVGGINKTGDDGVEYPVEEIFVHPDYVLSPEVIENDIALMQLSKCMEFSENVSPLLLDTVTSLDGGRPVVLSGWGYTSNDEQIIPDKLQWLNLTTLGHAECEEILQAKLPDNHLCAYRGQNQGACKGDSGGPLQSQGFAVGVVSYSSSSLCGAGLPDVYMRVSMFADWITETIRNNTV